MLTWTSKPDPPPLLLRLPAEIRALIFEFALAAPAATTTVVTYRLGAYEREGDAYHEATQPALTRVSRQVRAESLPVYYACNDFVLHSEPPRAGDTRRWLLAAAPHLPDLRRVSLWLRYAAAPNRMPPAGALSVSLVRARRHAPWEVDGERWRWITVCRRPDGVERDAQLIVRKLKDMTAVISSECAGPDAYMSVLMDLRSLYIDEKMSMG